jgi:hypothetical protein
LDARAATWSASVSVERRGGDARRVRGACASCAEAQAAWASSLPRQRPREREALMGELSLLHWLTVAVFIAIFIGLVVLVTRR